MVGEAVALNRTLLQHMAALLDERDVELSLLREPPEAFAWCDLRQLAASAQTMGSLAAALQQLA